MASAAADFQGTLAPFARSGAMTDSRPYRIALALSGGNALGSWQAGAFAAMAARGIEPDRIAAASAGAINGAVIAGNPPARAVERLRAFWSPAPTEAAGWWPAGMDAWRRTAAITAAMTGGRPDAFLPRPFLGQPWALGGPEPSLYDTAPLRSTLAQAVDWERVAAARPRLQVAAVDLETGEDVVFDAARERLGPDHVRASAALIPAFPPVEIGGRRYVDPGVSANLPLDALLADPGPEPLLVIALDLLPLATPPPATVGESAGRLQDLVFATQTRRTVDAWAEVYRLHGEAAPAVTLVRLAYADQEREVAGKAFDFSPESAAERWADGERRMAALLDRLAAGTLVADRPGLTVLGEPDEPPLVRGSFRLRTAGKAG